MEVPRIRRLQAQRYRLEGSICPICGQVSFPPRPQCPQCTHQSIPVAASGLVPITTSYRNLDVEILKGS